MNAKIEEIVEKLNILKENIDKMHQDPMGTSNKDPVASCGEIRLIYEHARLLNSETLDIVNKIKLNENFKNSKYDTTMDSWLSLKNGTYWIDPNQGYAGDSIQVHCNFKRAETMTCIKISYNQFGSWEYKHPMSMGTIFSQFNFLLWRALHVEQYINFLCGVDNDDNPSMTSSNKNNIDEKFIKSRINFEAFTKKSGKISSEILNFDDKCYDYPWISASPCQDQELYKSWKDAPQSTGSDKNQKISLKKIKLQTSQSRRLPIKKIFDVENEIMNFQGKLFSYLCFIEDFQRDSYETTTEEGPETSETNSDYSENLNTKSYDELEAEIEDLEHQLDVEEQLLDLKK